MSESVAFIRFLLGFQRASSPRDDVSEENSAREKALSHSALLSLVNDTFVTLGALGSEIT
jgi:hypothetical protein